MIQTNEQGNIKDLSGISSPSGFLVLTVFILHDLLDEDRRTELVLDMTP